MKDEYRVWLAAFLSFIVIGGCSKDESSSTDARTVESALCGRALHSEGDISHTFNVDCTGINLIKTVTSLSTGASFLSSWTDDEALARCQLSLFEPLDQPVHKLTHGDVNNLSHMIVAYGGSEWISTDGCMKLTKYEQATKTEPGIGEGQYETVLREFVTKVGPDGVPYQELSGRSAVARGKLDWCEYGNRDDCPVHFDSGLTKDVSVQAPGGFVQYELTSAFADGHGKATDCRVLIDKATGGMRVDMEIGFWQGLPITEYGRECMGTGQLSQIQPNSFVFQSVGVTGPGTYGPLTNCQIGPSFRWEVPRTWEGRMDLSACSTGYLAQTSWVVPTDNTMCTYSIGADPGRFMLDCTNARWSTNGPKPGEPVEGDFHLDADCDVEYR